MAFAGLSRAKRVALAPPRLANVKARRAKPVVASGPGFIGSAPRLGVAPSPHPPEIQTKLKVNAPNDRFEQEADRVAEQVMRMPDPSIATTSATLGVQRLCAECEEEVQRQPVEEEEELLQTKQAAGCAPVVTPKVTAEIVSMRGRGQPLPASERAFFEPRFGQDFSHVRIHTDARAATLAQALKAQAFTFGHHVVFAPTRYSPATAAGRRLLAHELSHVLQQENVPHHAIHRQELPVEEAEFDDEFGEPSEPPREEQELDEHRDSDPCNEKLDKLEPLYEFEECHPLIESTFEYQDLAGRRTSLEKNIENMTETKNRLLQEKQMIEQALPQQQELHDATLTPLLARRDELLIKERIAYDTYHRADTALQQALNSYWSRFGGIVVEHEKALLLREAIGAQRTQISTHLELVVLLLEKAVTSLAYIAQLAKVGELMKEFEEEWPAWAEELESLKKAEDDALDAYEPIDQELTAVSNEIDALEENDPTRKHNQVVVQIDAADKEVKSLKGRYEQDATEAGEIVKKREDAKQKCAQDYGFDAWTLFAVLEDYVNSCR